MLDILNTIAVNFDLPILDWIQATMKSDLMDKIWPIVTKFGDAGIFWILCALLCLWRPKTRKCGLAMAIGLVLGVVICNIILKPIVARPRPYDLQLEKFGVTISLLTKRQSDFSFPSGHTIASFEAAVPLFVYHKKLGIPAMLLAIAVSFSRLYLYLHYPTDVLVSVVLGTVFALIGVAIANVVMKNQRIEKGRYER